MIRLENTNGNEVAAAINDQRRQMGSPATGMVLTLLLVADEAHQADAVAAAAYAAREHPMRILALVSRGGRGKPRLDAEITVGGDQGPGEIAVLRLHGELARHAGSVAIPLLLSDTPVVAWWADRAPDVPGEDKIGSHAQRRITDSRIESRALAAWQKRAAGYRPGDTDLAWTQLTGWRTLLTSMLDEPFDPVTGVEVTAPASTAAAPMLTAWLHCRLDVPARLVRGRGPGITRVVLHTEGGDLTIRRRDGQRAFLSRPGRPDSIIALPIRDLGDLLAEELRRLDPDEVFAETLQAVAEIESPSGLS